MLHPTQLSKFLWPLAGLYLIDRGVGHITSYSDPTKLFPFIIEIEMAYSHIVFGLLTLEQSRRVWFRKKSIAPLLVFAVLLWSLIYYFTGVQQYIPWFPEFLFSINLLPIALVLLGQMKTFDRYAFRHSVDLLFTELKHLTGVKIAFGTLTSGIILLAANGYDYMDFMWIHY